MGPRPPYKNPPCSEPIWNSPDTKKVVTNKAVLMRAEDVDQDFKQLVEFIGLLLSAAGAKNEI